MDEAVIQAFFFTSNFVLASQEKTNPQMQMYDSMGCMKDDLIAAKGDQRHVKADVSECRSVTVQPWSTWDGW